MSCHEGVAESRMENIPVCKDSVTKPRPRCSHLLSSRRFEAMDESVAESGVVLYGSSYGPSETELGENIPGSIRILPICTVLSRYRMQCGHEISIRCNDAFRLASGEIQGKGNLATDLTGLLPIKLSY